MELKQAVKQTKYFLLDMDGTIYLDSNPIGDMKNTLASIRRSGRKIVYLTNNSSKTTDEYVDKLKRIGLFDDGDFVYGSGIATEEFLKEHRKGKKVFLLATEKIKNDFKSHGIELTDDHKADIAVLAFDTEVDYNGLVAFNECLVNGAEYIATHPDYVCPTEGISVPDVGSFISFFYTSSGRKPDLIIGKPSMVMGETITSIFSTSKDKCMMVGDRLMTDIAFGVNCGFHTLLVFSGETTIETLHKSDVKPENTLPDLNEIVKYL